MGRKFKVQRREKIETLRGSVEFRKLNVPDGFDSKELTDHRVSVTAIVTCLFGIGELKGGGGGGGKALTMTMTPWNLTHGQWSKNLTMATDILESAPWSMVKMVILWSNLVVKSKVYHFDHRKFAFRPWLWSK